MNEDKASRYNRLKRRATILSVAWGVVFVVGLLVSGLSIEMRNLADSWVRPLGPWPPVVPHRRIGDTTSAMLVVNAAPAALLTAAR